MILSAGLIGLVVGIVSLLNGWVSEEGHFVIALLIVSSLVSAFFALKWLVTKAYLKVKGKVEGTEFKVATKQTKAIKEVYKVFKDKYCPIIK